MTVGPRIENPNIVVISCDEMKVREDQYTQSVGGNTVALKFGSGLTDNEFIRSLAFEVDLNCVDMIVLGDGVVSEDYKQIVLRWLLTLPLLPVVISCSVPLGFVPSAVMSRELSNRETFGPTPVIVELCNWGGGGWLAA